MSSNLNLTCAVAHPPDIWVKLTQNLNSITSKKASDHLKSSVSPYSLCSHSLRTLELSAPSIISVASHFRGPSLCKDVTDVKFSPLALTFPSCSHNIWVMEEVKVTEESILSQQTDLWLSLPKCHLTAHSLTSSSPQPHCPALFSRPPPLLLSVTPKSMYFLHRMV